MSKREEALKKEQELKKELVPNPNVGEREIFTGFCSLFKIITNQEKSEKIGNGMIQILISNSTQRYRILMRSHKDLNEKLLNCYILGDLKKCAQKDKYQFSAIDYNDKPSKEDYYVVFLAEDTATKFKDAYMQSYLSNKKLLEKKK